MRIGPQRLPLPKENKLPELDGFNLRSEPLAPLLQCFRTALRDLSWPARPCNLLMCIFQGHEQREVIEPLGTLSTEEFKSSALFGASGTQKIACCTAKDGKLPLDHSSIV